MSNRVKRSKSKSKKDQNKRRHNAKMQEKNRMLNLKKEMMARAIIGGR